MRFTINTINKRAFTLIELLVSISIMVVLISYFVNVQHNAKEQSELLETKNFLTQVAEAIHAFKADWGEVPEDLGYLFLPQKLRMLASKKGITGKTSFTPYIDYNVRTDKKLGWCCPYYALYGQTNHKYGALSSTEKCGVSFFSGGWKICGSKCSYLCTFDTTPPEGTVLYGPQITNYVNTPMVDKWGNIIYYKKNANGGYFLMSAGPDGLATPDMTTFLTGSAYPASYSPSAANNKDNILYGKY